MEKPGSAVRAGVGSLACVFPHVDLQLIISDQEKMRNEEAGREERERSKTLITDSQYIKPFPNVHNRCKRVPYRVKRTPQAEHWKGFSPVCVLMCRGSFPAPWMIF